MTYPTGDKYTGCWKGGLRSSKVRLFLYPSLPPLRPPKKYNRGLTVRTLLQGKMMYANGDIYNGNWDENLPNGQGNLLCATGLSYVGQFAMGQVRTFF